MAKAIEVKNLIALLEEVPDDWLIVANKLGNLSLLKLTDNEYRYAGYIDLEWGEMDFVENEE